MTRLVIYEQEVEGVEYPGIFIAKIQSNGTTIKMKYDLEEQDDTYDGYYTDKTVVFLHPKCVNYNFNVEYNLDETIDEVVAFLRENGWEITTRKVKI